MRESKKTQYNDEGVDLNIYTARRHNDIEYYADRLDYLREFQKDKFDMIATIIEMSVLLPYDVKDYKNNSNKNTTIRNISQIKTERYIQTINNFSRVFSEEECKRSKLTK